MKVTVIPLNGTVSNGTGSVGNEPKPSKLQHC